MKHKTLMRRMLAAGAAAVCAGATQVSAQSVDALLDKLVDKGILTVKEANDLKEESQRNFTQAYSVKTGLPDWVSSLKFSGDVRGRFEGFYSDAAGPATNNFNFVDRNRFRYRVRLGATINMLENFEAGLRLSSDETASGGANNEGDPISGNTTFQNNGSKKLVYIDQAYGKWYALNTADWTAALTVGKMENPFLFDDMVFDPDYTPEGIAFQAGYRIDNRHSLKLNAAGFVLDEFSASSDDPYLLGAQLRWDAAWNTRWGSTLGIAALSIDSAGILTNSVVPNINRGNTRNADGTLTYHFNPVIVDAALTYTAPRFPFYKGPFPVKIGGEYMNNPAAPSDADNYAWNVGVMFGRSGRKGTWDVSYTYKWLGANSWYEELVDSDFGAFYGAVPPGSGLASPVSTSNAYNSGTNVKGHIFRLAYSCTDSVTLSVKWFMTELIDSFPAGGDSQMNRVQVDAVWKF